METLAAIIKSGLVDNIIVIDPNDAATVAYFKAIVLPQGSSVSIGWHYDGTNLTPPAIVPDTSPQPAAFAQAVKFALGGIETVVTMPASIQPIFQWFYMALQVQNWNDMQIIIIASRVALDAVNPAIYTEVKAAAVIYNIPIILP